jgi:hypothetical protein
VFEKAQDFEAVAVGHFEIGDDIAGELKLRAIGVSAVALEVRDGFRSVVDDLDDAIGIDATQRSLNQIAIVRIVINDQNRVSLRFHSRFSAENK